MSSGRHRSSPSAWKPSVSGADFTDIREQNKTCTPLFRSEVKSATVSQEAAESRQEQPVKAESQVLEAVSAKSAEQARFHR